MTSQSDAGTGHKFELHVSRRGRWSPVETFPDRKSARRQAAGLLEQAEVWATRIVRASNDTEAATPTVVLEEWAPPRHTETVRAGVAEDPPVCRTLADYYGLASRLTISRALRTYLDKWTITPSEILHVHKEWRRLTTDSLVSTVIDRVAGVQAQITGQDSRGRAGEISEAIEKIGKHAHAVERRTDLPNLDEMDFRKAAARLGRIEPNPEKRDYLTRATLCRSLAERRKWATKLTFVLDRIDVQADPAETAIFDGLVADLLGSSLVVQNLLGWQTNLANAIRALADLSEGRFPVPDGPAGGIAERVNDLLGTGLFPASRAALIDRACSQLDTSQPLDRTRNIGEQAAFAQVLDRFLLPDGFLGGAKVAEALTLRQSRTVERGGSAGRNDAMQNVITALPDTYLRTVYLCELARTPFARKHPEDVASVLEAVVLGISSVDACAPPSLPPRDKMARVARLHRLLATAPVAPEIRDRLVGHLDALLLRYLASERVLERLDAPEASARSRFIRLVEFYASDALTGKAADLVRQGILTHVRQPGFEDGFVRDLSGDERQVSLQALRDLLSRFDLS